MSKVTRFLDGDNSEGGQVATKIFTQNKNDILNVFYF